MTEPLDIEQHDALLGYLRAAGNIPTGEAPACTTLTGGVSSRTVLVERREGPDWVIKQSLARLRVAVEWYSDPARLVFPIRHPSLTAEFPKVQPAPLSRPRV